MVNSGIKNYIFSIFVISGIFFVLVFLVWDIGLFFVDVKFCIVMVYLVLVMRLVIR